MSFKNYFTNIMIIYFNSYSTIKDIFHFTSLNIYGKWLWATILIYKVIYFFYV